ncbi:MAG: FkbM family methyltransferase [Ruminococcus flavefaciens]|nr:FkbM family methyltransferase [Ruminococcus flavefaciens]
MSIEYDSVETEIIMKKLSGITDNLPAVDFSGDGINIKMLDSLDRMNKTSVNRSYRPIQSDGLKGKISCAFKRLIRRLTFWFVEPCMIQQTEYNSANNVFSAEVNSELNTMRSRLENMEKLEKQIIEINGQLAEMKNVISDINLSFSQSGEDSIIKYIFSTLRRDIKDCTYLDLGANHAVHLSNTYAFYSQGARGVLLEANPELAQELTEKRPEDIVINKCLAEKSGESLDFYIMNGDGLSTTDYQSAQNFIKENPALEITKKITVDSVTINEIIDEYFPEKAPDIMNIDIEGMELAVLKMTDFEKFRPLVIICEMIEYKNGLTVGQKNNEILEFMKKNDYVEFAFTGINSIFIDKRQGEITE